MKLKYNKKTDKLELKKIKWIDTVNLDETIMVILRDLINHFADNGIYHYTEQDRKELHEFADEFNEYLIFEDAMAEIEFETGEEMLNYYEDKWKEIEDNLQELFIKLAKILPSMWR